MYIYIYMYVYVYVCVLVVFYAGESHQALEEFELQQKDVGCETFQCVNAAMASPTRLLSTKVYKRKPKTHLRKLICFNV